LVITACTCNAGYTGTNGGVCSGCLPGTYKILTGDSNCENCPTGSISPVASTILTQCVCRIGWTGADGDDCVQCGIGQYKSVPGNSECLDCFANSHSLAGSADCTCNVGWNGGNSGICTQCAAGTYNSRTLYEAELKGATCQSNSNGLYKDNGDTRNGAPVYAKVGGTFARFLWKNAGDGVYVTSATLGATAVNLISNTQNITETTTMRQSCNAAFVSDSNIVLSVKFLALTCSLCTVCK